MAIQPAWRPITSTTITRSCDSAVVCRRSIASVAICTAVWKPNVKSVAPMSLSIVFGTPTTGSPSRCKRSATPSVSSPPIGISASRRSRSKVSRSAASARRATAKGLVREVPRIVPPRGKDARPCSRASSSIASSRQHARPAVAKAEEAVLADAHAAAHDRADHRVQARTVSAAGENPYAQHCHPRHSESP